jgi:hypothetical protein
MLYGTHVLRCSRFGAMTHTSFSDPYCPSRVFGIVEVLGPVQIWREA